MEIKDFNFDDFDFDTNLDFGIKSVSSDDVDQSKIQTEKLEKVSVITFALSSSHSHASKIIVSHDSPKKRENI